VGGAAVGDGGAVDTDGSVGSVTLTLRSVRCFCTSAELACKKGESARVEYAFISGHGSSNNARSGWSTADLRADGARLGGSALVGDGALLCDGTRVGSSARVGARPARAADTMAARRDTTDTIKTREYIVSWIALRK